MEREPIRQEGPSGCGVACVAFVLGIDYKTSLGLFPGGQIKAQNEGFFCREIVNALRSNGLIYEYRYINRRIQPHISKEDTIVFVRRSDLYPAGHYLCFHNGKWMDPWINFPDNVIRAGFRHKLPDKPIYAILKLENSFP